MRNARQPTCRRASCLERDSCWYWEMLRCSRRRSADVGFWRKPCRTTFGSRCPKRRWSPDWCLTSKYQDGNSEADARYAQRAVVTLSFHAIEASGLASPPAPRNTPPIRLRSTGSCYRFQGSRLLMRAKAVRNQVQALEPVLREARRLGDRLARKLHEGANDATH